MDVLKFMKERRRMCNYYSMCQECPRANESTCVIEDMRIEELEKLISDVEQWSKEHPLRTRLQDFREKHPDVSMETDGTPAICCIALGYRQYDCDPLKENGVDCWNMPVEED